MKKKKENTKLYSVLMSFIFTMFTVYTLWTIFYFLNESDYLTLDLRSSISLGTMIILISAILICYIIFENKLMNKFNLNKTIYNITLIPTWCLSNLYLSSFMSYLVSKEAIHFCDTTEVDLFFGSCHFNGIEYTILGYYSLIIIVLFIIIKLIKLLINHIKRIS